MANITSPTRKLANGTMIVPIETELFGNCAFEPYNYHSPFAGPLQKDWRTEHGKTQGLMGRPAEEDECQTPVRAEPVNEAR